MYYENLYYFCTADNKAEGTASKNKDVCHLCLTLSREKSI